MKDYTTLDKHIWKNQILKRDFTFYEIQDQEVHLCGNFADFVYKVSGQDLQRFISLCSIIGYSLHNYNEGKSKATIFTDSTVSDIADGRTGKTLLCKALGQIRNYCELNGKDFKTDDKHKYQQCNLDTQIIHLNDVKKNFDIDCLFNDITEGLKVERKSKDPFIIRAKILISTNKTIYIEGASAKDRTLEFEFSNYFSDKLSPQQEYKQWFFADWDSNEWKLFDNFMMYCTSVYLKNGVVEVKNNNLGQRKLLDHTSPEFIDFMQDLNIVYDEKYNKKELYESFKERYSDFNNDRFYQKTFTRWLRTYTLYSDQVKPIDKVNDEIRSNGKDFIFFRKS